MTGFPPGLSWRPGSWLVLSPPCHGQPPGSRWPPLTSRQGPQSFTASPTPSLPHSLNGLCLSFPLYLHPPPRAGDEPLTQPSCLSHHLMLPVSRPIPLSSQNLGSWSYPGRSPSLLLKTDPFSCQPDPNTVPAGTLPLPWLLETSHLLWPALFPIPTSPYVLIFFLTSLCQPLQQVGLRPLEVKSQGKGTDGCFAGLALRSRRSPSPRSGVSRRQPTGNHSPLPVFLKFYWNTTQPAIYILSAAAFVLQRQS